MTLSGLFGDMYVVFASGLICYLILPWCLAVMLTDLVMRRWGVFNRDDLG